MEYLGLFLSAFRFGHYKSTIVMILFLNDAGPDGRFQPNRIIGWKKWITQIESSAPSV